MMSSSMRWSLTGVEVLWTRKTSRPRTFSAISIWISPSENLPTSQRPIGISRYSQMSSTRGLLEFPEKTTSSDSVSGMRGLLQRAASAGLPASDRGRGRRGAARKLAVVLGEDHLLHPLAGFAVQRVGNVLEGSVLPALCRHGHEQAGISVDHLEVPNDEAVVEGDGDVGFQPFLADRKDPHLGDLHDAAPLDATRRPSIPNSRR